MELGRAMSMRVFEHFSGFMEDTTNISHIVSDTVCRRQMLFN